ncbi:MAG TPA: HAMP domain-containing sensor histidine kinase [Fervidobacterium sp.]|nr:HAMP domain-containing sensor histidine kinase [Fervidobacterium sp.]HQE47891.1 HAMP domain-containing sensor histidine kinase [Fervidobacterium sp.]HUM42058.1 HAMP domain-containing sensor histidine kinase [Fervidobacterium sp.]
MEVQQLLSKYMLEISKVSDEKSLYIALSGILRRITDYQTLNVISQSSILYSEPVNDIIDEALFMEYLPWVEERLYPTFLPKDDGYVGLIPIFKGKKLLSTIVLTTSDEPTAEVIDYLQLLSYLSGLTLENLRLIDFVDKTREYFETILNLSNDGVIVLYQGEIEFSNAKGSEIIEDYPIVLQEIEEKIGDNETFFEVELPNTFLSISTKEIELQGEPRILVDVRNITSEKEVEKLREVDKIKTNFIANVSHELKTPLTAIKAYTETIMNVPMTQEEIREFSETIYNQSLKLEGILNDLLDFSQLESHTLKILKEPTDLCEVVNRSILTVNHLAVHYDVKIEFDCNNSIEINCDKKRIEQIMVNLLTNAIKFSDKNKKQKIVRIEMENDDKTVKIVVEDNGVGIPADKLDRIFDKFYRADIELTYSIPGTGLGLAIVKEIVEMHNGTITVESREGEWTRFIVQLPKS